MVIKLNVETIKGRGEFVGEADTRPGAQENYNKILEDYAAKYPFHGRYEEAPGQGLRDYGREVAAPPSTASTNK